MIFAVVMAGGIFFIYILLSGSPGIIPYTGVSNDEQEKNGIFHVKEIRNMTTEIPLELKNDVEKMRGFNLAVSRWDIDPANKIFIVYTYTRTDPAIAQIVEGRKAGNWTIELVYDKEFVDRMNKASDEIYEIPEMKVSGIQWSVGGYQNPPVYEAIVYVLEYSPENRKLNGTELEGWKMLVYRAASYPPNKIFMV